MQKQEVRNVVERARSQKWNEDRLALSDMDTQATAQGQLYRFAEYKAEVPLELRQGDPVDAHLAVHRTFDDNGTADTETVSLNYDLVDADSVANDVLVYRSGNLISPSSVDYANNTVDIDTNGNSETYDIYYIAGDQARGVFRVKAPKNVQHEPGEFDIGLANVRDQGRDPIEFDFAHPLEAIVPTDWKVQVLVDAPYSVEYENNSRGSVATNMLMSIPINRASRPVEGLSRLKREAVGTIDGM